MVLERIFFSDEESIYRFRYKYRHQDIAKYIFFIRRPTYLDSGLSAHAFVLAPPIMHATYLSYAGIDEDTDGEVGWKDCSNRFGM